MFKRESIFTLVTVTMFLGLLFFSGSANAQTLYTGLVIDARGLGILPGMSPKIYDTAGKEVYGTMMVDPDFVIEKGIAGFTSSVDSAIDEGLVGGNPIIVKAVSLADDPSRSSVVVQDGDAEKILEANASAAFLSAYRVAIIM